MPVPAPVTFGQQRLTNLTPTARGGTVIPSVATPNTKSGWTVVIASTAEDAYGLWLGVRDVATSSASTPHLLDLGVGPAGQERVLVPNLDVGHAAGFVAQLMLRYWFPCYIPKGSRVVARSQWAITQRSPRVFLSLDAVPWYGIGIVGPVVDYGTDLANSRGTGVLSGANAWGDWVQLGTTSRDHTFWNVAIDGAYDALPDDDLLVEVGIGPAPRQVSLGVRRYRSNNTSILSGGPFPLMLATRPVPAGTPVWARLASGAALTFGVIVYGA
jgi:hypothetical protein